MGINYYYILELPRHATLSEINKAYRKLSLKYHPQKNKTLEAVESFQKISEAYDVLSDPKRRAVYDQFGEVGLKRGIPLGKGEVIDPYVFHGNAELVFREFFGTDNPFTDLFHGFQTDMTRVFGGKSGTALKKQDPPIMRELFLTLEEIFYGGIKKVKISRRVLQEENTSSVIMDKILTIYVKKGWREGTKIIFYKEGDQGPNSIPADIIFITKDKPHHIYKRSGDDLILNQSVSIAKALTGCQVNVTTLDGRKLVIPINDIVKPGYQKIVHGEGLPISKDPEHNRGNLIIEFTIVYPDLLLADQKKLIKQALLK